MIVKVVIILFLIKGQLAWYWKRSYKQNHQRLNVEQPLNNGKSWFKKWFVGFTDGEGSFTITRQGNKVKVLII